MRSSEPDPANPWPHDMVLSVSSQDSGALVALAVAEAWQVDLGVPRLDPPPSGVVVVPAPSDAETRARAAWSAAIARMRERGGDARSPVHDEQRRVELDVDRDAVDAWIRSMPSPIPTGALHEQPERRDVAATVLAWEAGLARILTLPFADRWVARSAGLLLVDETTRRDPVRYVDALLAYADDALPRVI